MSLRVFKSGEDSLAVEVSSPQSKSSFKWFTPLYPEEAVELQNIDPMNLVKVIFDGKRFYVSFLVIWTAKVLDDRKAVMGTLGYEDSINVLNNIYDRLAYDALSAVKPSKKASK